MVSRFVRTLRLLKELSFLGTRALTIVYLPLLVSVYGLHWSLRFCSLFLFSCILSISLSITSLYLRILPSPFVGYSECLVHSLMLLRSAVPHFSCMQWHHISARTILQIPTLHWNPSPANRSFKKAWAWEVVRVGSWVGARMGEVRRGTGS